MTYFVEGVSQHNQPQQQVRRVGEYESLEEAITAAKKGVERSLRKEFKRGMEAGKLFSLYEARGEHMFIFQDKANTLNVPGFEHRQYAMSRAEEICRGRK